jgi:hypothetical protein
LSTSDPEWTPEKQAAWDATYPPGSHVQLENSTIVETVIIVEPDYGTCDGCGMEFTEATWGERHDIHARADLSDEANAERSGLEGDYHPDLPDADVRAMKRGGPMRRSAMPPRKTSMPRTGSKLVQPKRPSRPTGYPSQSGFSDAVKAKVRARSGGWCEARIVGVCTGRASQIHHRKLRRHGDHRLITALHLCLECHAFAHDHPEFSYRMGLLVQAHRDPKTVPVHAEAIPERSSGSRPTDA